MATIKNTRAKLPSKPTTSTRTAGRKPRQVTVETDNVHTTIPNAMTPWLVTEADGRVLKMVGHFGRPGTVSYVVTRRTHPDLAPGDVVTVYPHAKPKEESVILIKRANHLLFVEARERGETDEFLGVAAEMGTSYLDAARLVTEDDRKKVNRLRLIETLQTDPAFGAKNLYEGERSISEPLDRWRHRLNFGLALATAEDNNDDFSNDAFATYLRVGMLDSAEYGKARDAFRAADGKDDHYSPDLEDPDGDQDWHLRVLLATHIRAGMLIERVLAAGGDAGRLL